ncbi:MAG: hypothetical protein AAFX94_25895, partial [Myxococcota bacterium]
MCAAGHSLANDREQHPVVLESIENVLSSNWMGFGRSFPSENSLPKLVEARCASTLTSFREIHISFMLVQAVRLDLGFDPESMKPVLCFGFLEAWSSTPKSMKPK